MAEPDRTAQNLPPAQWLETTLYEILHGAKPGIDLNDPSQKWFYDQLQNMYKAGMLSAEPESYIFLLPEEDPNDPDLHKFKGVTRIEALPKALTTQSDDLTTQLREKHIYNTKVLGEDHRYLYSQDPLDQLTDSDSFILPSAGLASLYQYVRLINARNEGQIDLEGKTVVVQNKNGFWDPFLDFMPVDENDSDVHLTKTRHDTVNIILDELGEQDKMKPARISVHSHAMKAGDTLFVITGNTKKPIDYRKVFNERRSGIDVRHFQQVFSQRPKGATEESYSYIGNLLEKYEEFYELIKSGYGPEAFIEELETKGYDLDKAFVLFDDGGMATQENLTAGPEFDNTTDVRRNPYSKHGPGPEMKGILGAIQNQPYKGLTGNRGLFKRMEDAALRISESRGSESDDDLRASLRAQDEAASIVVPVKEFIEQIKAGVSFEDIVKSDISYFFSARTENKMIFEPRPNEIAVDGKNFMVPRHDPKGRTMAEIPNYVARHSTTAQLVKAIARTFGFDGIEAEQNALSDHFTAAREKQLKLATHRSIIKGDPGLMVPGTAYRIQDGNAGFYSLEEPRIHEIEREDGEIMEVSSALNNFADMCSQVDGFVFMDDDETMSGDDFFWERNFIAYSIHVGNQITDKTIAEKPSVFVNGGTWEEHLDTFKAFCGGLIPELPDYLCKIVDKEEDLQDTLAKSFQGYAPHEVPTYQFREGGEKAPEHLFRVTVYSSASSTDSELKASAREFSFEASAMGFAVINGGGTEPDGLMHETSDGVHDSRNDFAPFLKNMGIDHPETHIASIHCEDTAQEEGLRDDNDYWCVWPNIFLRMQDLQDTDAEVVLPGGAGTLQEVCASILMRKYGLSPIEHRPLIIVNKNGVYDSFLKTIPEQDKKEYNIHVVREESEALDILLAAREARDMVPENLAYNLEEMRELKSIYEHQKGFSCKPSDNQPKPSA